ACAASPTSSPAVAAATEGATRSSRSPADIPNASAACCRRRRRPSTSLAPYPPRMSAPRVIVVAKRTSYQRFVEEEGDPRASLLVKKKDPAVRSWLDSHAEHQRTLELVIRELARAGAQTLLLRRAHAAFDTSDAALVI